MDWSDPERIVALALALGVVTGAGAWRTVDRRRTRRAVLRGLADPDEGRRTAMISAVTAQGIGTYAAPLLKLARRENEPAVRTALALAVARNQWEPASDRRLVALRVWAHEELTRRPTTGRVPLALAPAVPVEPVLPVLPVPSVQPVPSVLPVPLVQPAPAQEVVR